MKALKKAVTLSGGFLAVTIDRQRRIIERLSDSVSDSETCEIPTGAKKYKLKILKATYSVAFLTLCCSIKTIKTETSAGLTPPILNA